MFEPSRLAADYLADAYAQVIPARKLLMQEKRGLSKSLNVTSERAERREQA